MPLGRRRFLQLSALAAGPLVLPGAACRGKEPAAAPPDPVVIVGGGLAGLRAAALLRAAGRQVVVLEARPDPGGRVRTSRAPFDAGLYWEAGAIRIASTHQRVLALASDFGLNVIPFDSSNGSSVITLGRTSIRVDELSRTRVPLDLKRDEKGLSQGALLERYVGDLPATLGEFDPPADAWTGWTSYDRMTWPGWLRSRGASEDAVRLMTLGGDSSELSALYVLRQYALLRGVTQFYKIEGGMDRLPRALAAGLGDAVRYGAGVTAMDQSGGSSVRVDYTQDGEQRSVRAERVVLTVPASTMSRIGIRPALTPEKRRSLDIPYYPAARFLLQSRSRFWHESGLSGYARTDQPAEIWDATYELEGQGGILGVTVGGAIGRTVGDMSEEQSLSFVRDLAGVAFRPLSSQFQKGSAHRWALDPWSQGAFAVFHPGQMTAMMPHIARPEGRIHFAGEHTSAWMGWMEGALESGERAAREVLTLT